MTTPDRFLAERIGLRVEGATRARLDRVVRDAARDAGCPEYRYGRMLAEDPVRAQELIDRVTVQETGFFRHPEQFALLADHLRADDRGGAIWSAGCANGQEAWSLAMLLEEHRLPGWHVVASDVSATALARARAGVYVQRELRGLSEPRQRRFLQGGAVSLRLRGRVRFLHHNVAKAGPPAEAGECRVVLCRNLLIYLHRPAIDQFLEGLRRRMPVGALLLIGMGEAIGPIEGFRPGPMAGVFVRQPDSPPFTAGVAEPARATSLRDEIARRR